MLETARNYASFLRSRFRGGNLRSSLSDNDAYPSFCADAADQDRIFESFRDSTVYAEILEHVSYSLGRRYLEVISRDPKFLDSARAICASDFVGSPRRFAYERIGMASPTTLRYVKVAQDLDRYFGSLQGKSVLEIGVGYGGQCRVLASLYGPLDYTLVDLEPVLRLTKRFLAANAVEVVARYQDPADLSPRRCDVLISNYAFSELRRDVQDMYMVNFVSIAKSGYMTFNHINPRGFQSMSVHDFAERMHGVILPERPMSYPGNKVVVWGVS
jgi:hypothetical protein